MYIGCFLLGLIIGYFIQRIQTKKVQKELTKTKTELTKKIVESYGKVAELEDTIKLLKSKLT